MKKLRGQERQGAFTFRELCLFDLDFAKVWARGMFGEDTTKRFEKWLDTHPETAIEESLAAKLRALHTYCCYQFRTHKDPRMIDKIAKTAMELSKAEQNLAAYIATSAEGGGVTVNVGDSHNE